jgi:hypothetical protein
MTKLIEQDIWNWIKNYIEINHKFYDYKFPPCPYAKATRLKGLMSVNAYTTGNPIKFIQQQINDLLDEKKFNVCVMIFPSKMKWHYYLHWKIRQLNKTIIPKDFYLQYGKALKTSSRYAGMFENGPYFIVIVNKLSDVLSGSRSLLSTNYYKNWSKKHFDEVVVRRQKKVNKYIKDYDEMD